MAVFNTGLPASGALHLQQCGSCGYLNYPARELCGRCLGDALKWQPVKDSGTVQSRSELHYSLEQVYADHLPWSVVSVKLDCGPIVFAHAVQNMAAGDSVTLGVVEDLEGNRMLLARSGEATPNSSWLTDKGLREISA